MEATKSWTLNIASKPLSKPIKKSFRIWLCRRIPCPNCNIMVNSTKKAVKFRTKLLPLSKTKVVNRLNELILTKSTNQKWHSPQPYLKSISKQMNQSEAHSLTGPIRGLQTSKEAKMDKKPQRVKIINRVLKPDSLMVKI